MVIHITYETLFDLLRKERSLEDLQDLDQWFWKHVVDYLNERESFLKTTSQLEQEKTHIQLFNIKRIIREIYDRRERKIIQLAMNVIRSNDPSFVDKRGMLAEEKKLFEESVSLLLTYKRGILDQVCANNLPIISPGTYDKPPESESHARKETPEDTPSSSPSEQFINTSSDEDTQILNDHLASDKEGVLLVKFKVSVPKFIGKNKEVFGPFDVGTVTSLPSNIANILLKKEKVEKVMAV